MKLVLINSENYTLEDFANMDDIKFLDYYKYKTAQEVFDFGTELEEMIREKLDINPKFSPFGCYHIRKYETPLKPFMIKDEDLDGYFSLQLGWVTRKQFERILTKEWMKETGITIDKIRKNRSAPIIEGMYT